MRPELGPAEEEHALAGPDLETRGVERDAPVPGLDADPVEDEALARALAALDEPGARLDGVEVEQRLAEVHHPEQRRPPVGDACRCCRRTSAATTAPG